MRKDNVSIHGVCGRVELLIDERNLLFLVRVEVLLFVILQVGLVCIVNVFVVFT